MSIWANEQNKAMKVFSQLYVGIRAASAGTPLGFATPYEDNAAGRKRQLTVNCWMHNVGEKKIIDNVPATGFRVTDDVKRVYWGGGNVVWRIEDPRGFELEIQSNNLMAIIQVSGVGENGVIPGHCMWGRDGPNNVLLHEKSEEYRNAVLAAETLKAPSQVKKSDREVGAVYRRVDGTLALYAGEVHVTLLNDESEEAYGDVITKLHGGSFAPGHLRTLVAEPSIKYEAMIEITRFGDDNRAKVASYGKLYKKAPLVERTDVKVDFEINSSTLTALNWEFAASKPTPIRILAVSLNPIPNPVITLVKLPLEKFTQLITHVARYSAHYKPGNGRLPYGQLTDHRYGTVIEINGELSTHISDIGDSFAHNSAKQTEPTYSIAWDCQITGNKLLASNSVHSHLNPLMTSDISWARTRFSTFFTGSRSAPQVQHVVLPNHGSVQEFNDYVQQLYDDGKIMYMTVEESK